MRMLFGAFLGGLCSLFIFLPPLNTFVLLLINIVSAALIIIVSFKWISKTHYIKQLVVFLISSALFAGIAAALWFFVAPTGFHVINGVVYYNVSPLMLTGLTVISYGALYIYDKLTHKKIAKTHDYILKINCGAGDIELRVLYDTGHHLTDAFSGSPVAIVSKSDISSILTQELRNSINFFERDNTNISADSSSNSSVATKLKLAPKTHLRAIPYTSIGGVGILPAFKPKKALLMYANRLNSGVKEKDITGIYIALTDVLARGEYQGIIGTDIANLL